jgi:hypothetical protein
MQVGSIMLNRRLALLFLLPIFSAACNNRANETDGGPCSYEESIFPARLISIIPKTDETYDAVFKLQNIKSFRGRDTIYYSELNNDHFISLKEMPANNMVPGKDYSYTVKNIKSGSCNPHIETLSLQPYTGK